MKRLKDWRARFEAVMDEIRLKPFDWSEQHDCGLGLAARVVNEITGENFGEEFKGKYNSKVGAYKALKEKGFKNLADYVASLTEEIHPSQCKIGDVVAYPMDSKFKYSLGIVNGDRAFVLSEVGIGTKDLLEAERAFRVG